MAFRQCSRGEQSLQDRTFNEIRPEPRANAVEICNVTKIFDDGDRPVVAVEDLSVAIRENELFTLLGPSGCGKTTLLRLIAGLEHPTTGHILLQGSDITPLPPYQRSVNTVFQSYALFPHLTVAGNIAFGLEMLGKPRSEVADSVTEMLRLVRLEALKDRRIGQLSGGQQQRVALARALAPHPQVLLLDEPLSALDLKLRKAMQIELKRLQKQTRITFVFVTHDQSEALAMSDRIGVMNAGRILQIGTPHEIYEQPTERFVAQFIGDSNFLKAELIAVHNGRAELRLSSGSTVCTRCTGLPAKATETPGRRVSLVIRSEHATLTRTLNKAVLSGEIDNVVYLGTDTCYHLKLAGGEPFVVRMQSRHNEEPPFREGETVGIELHGNTVRILGD